MNSTRRSFLSAAWSGAATAAAAGWGFQPAQAAEAKPPSPGDVHRELVQGNLRFATGHARHPHASPAWVKRVGTAGQHPHAAVLCCSDSRVVPELIFDQGLGDLFTVRVAGNVVNEDELASIEYAAEHFAVPLCVVLGHSGCGAVKAVVQDEHLPVEIDHLVTHIREAYARAKAVHPGATPDQLLDATVRANVIRSVQLLKDTASDVRSLVQAGRLRIEGCVYNLVSGRVSWIGAPELDAKQPA